jgi:hypothetical protein
VVAGSSVDGVLVDALSCLIFAAVALALFPRKRFRMSSLKGMRRVFMQDKKDIPCHAYTQMLQDGETCTLPATRRGDALRTQKEVSHLS